MAFGVFASGGSAQDGEGCEFCPNLSLSSIEAEVVGDVVVVDATVRNTGANSSSETTVEAVVSGWDPGSASVRVLDPDESEPVSIRLAIPADARGNGHEVAATVDPANAIDETSEEDNADRTKIFIPAATLSPDLTVSRSASPRVESGVVILPVLVANRGTAAAPATSARAEAAGWTPVTTPVSAFEAGGEAPVELRLSIPTGATGSHVFTVTVDPEGAIAETSEENNAVRLEAVVPGRTPTAAADLALTRARGRVAGKTLVLTAVVRSVGDAAAPATSVEARAPGWSPVTTAVPALDPGAARGVRLRLPIRDEQREADHEFTLTVDPGDVVSEASEENNYATAAVLVPRAASPDLTVVTQGEPTVQDEQVTLRILIRNIGDASSETTSVEATAPGWEPVRASVEALQRGGEQTEELQLTVPEDSPATEQEFVVTVDPDDEIEEGSEANNVVAAAAAIPARPSDGGLPVKTILLIALGVAVALALGAVLYFPRAATRARSRGYGREYRKVEDPLDRTLAGPEPLARVVNTGFAPAENPGSPLSANQTLQCAASYDFWLDVGEAVPESIERVATALPDQVPEETTLKVALFSLDGGLELDPDLQVADLHIGPDGSDERIFFPLRTGKEPGIAQLRCSIYHGHTLVQSRVIRAHVTSESEELDGALESTVDYTLAPSLDPAHLEKLPQHRLSVMLNRNGDGTHGFSFVGEEELKSEATFGELELQDFVERTRGALRKAAWGDAQSWDKQKRYLYEQVDPERLRRDLISLAVSGFRVYAAIASRLGEGDAAKLNDIMHRPGFVQIASKESPTQLLPAAMVYDYMGFRTTERTEDYSLCQDYLTSLDSGTPLEDTRCFQGGCRSRGQKTVVCPSGFWGFRHALGVPVSVRPGDDAPAEILPAGERSLTVAVSTDPQFLLRADHELQLRELFQGYGWNYAASQEDALRVLKQERSQIVYFYCHGGVLDGTPYIQVGPVDEQGITADLLFTEQIRWTEPRPLVFINGCRTTALEPEKALEFVRPLVQESGAAGVIGTEITVFEPLATVFAKECLSRFLLGVPIGEAVRCARLALLKEGNPLGLVYIPFVLAGLRLGD